MLRKGFNVLAIEPDPQAAYCLRENLLRHGPYENEWMIDTRVSHDHSGKVTYFLEPHSADSSIFPSMDRPSKPIAAKADRLDDIVAERIGDRAVCAMKMDAEGAEPEALGGATALLRKCPRVAIDAGFERQGQSTVAACRKIVGNAGFFISPELLSEGIVSGRRKHDGIAMRAEVGHQSAAMPGAHCEGPVRSIDCAPTKSRWGWTYCLRPSANEAAHPPRKRPGGYSPLLAPTPFVGIPS